MFVFGIARARNRIYAFKGTGEFFPPCWQFLSSRQTARYHWKSRLVTGVPVPVEVVEWIYRPFAPEVVRGL
jgi:hypothetical protein